MSSPYLGHRGAKQTRVLRKIEIRKKRWRGEREKKPRGLRLACGTVVCVCCATGRVSPAGRSEGREGGGVSVHVPLSLSSQQRLKEGERERERVSCSRVGIYPSN